MDPEQEIADGKDDDVDMIALPQTSPATQGSASGDDDANPTAEASNDASDSQQTLPADQELPIRTGESYNLSATTGSELTEKADVPPIAEQITTIQTLLKAFAETPVQEGDTAYLVSKLWLDKALALGNGAKNAGKGPVDLSLGPVDNSDIIQAAFKDANGQEFVKLKPGMGQGHFELFPKDAWDLLVGWHGLKAGQWPILRTAHNTAPDVTSMPNIQYEFYPPVFSIHRVWSAASPLPIEQALKLKNPPPPLIVHSSSYRLHDFLKEAKTHVGVPLDRKVRVWMLLQTLPAGEATTPPAGLSTPPSSPGPIDVVPGSFPHLLVEVDKFLQLERDTQRALVDAHDSTHHANYNGSRSLATAGLTVDQALVIDENTGARDEWVSNCTPKTVAKGLATRSSASSLVAQSKGIGSGRNSPAPGVTTRGRAQQQARSGRTLGCVGLQNLGNTCYMNSALQCVRSVEELTKYFLTHEAEKEVNPDNPLSHNGDVARAYGRLLEEIYRDPPPNSVTPRQFKNVIGRYAPSFSGYGQQDSQEFLGFLLDGLQEDLNRIKKKPYIEKPDSTDDMVNNPAAIREMAAKVWDITKKRDDSVIADLFTGMYKSTLVCPVCSKVSITFDPFTNLTLPLPVGNVWTHRVKYFPLNDVPVEITVELDKNSSIKALKEFVSARVGVPVERLMAAEEFREKFFKLYEELSSVAEEIQGNDVCVVHELEAPPTNIPVIKNPKKQGKYRSMVDIDLEDREARIWEDPASERIVVPVIHRVVSDESKYGRRTRKNLSTSPPHFIVLTREEARSEDIIRRKILEKVATFTTWPVLHEDDNDEATEPEDGTDPEMVNNTSSDGDSHVIAKSVEGEEELVDVTMKDADTGSAVLSKYPLLLKKFNTRRPKFVDPREFLDPYLQSLFNLYYFTDSDYSVPSGWQSVQDNTQLPALSTRQPKPAASDVDMNSPATWDGSEDSGSDEIPDSQPSTTTRMADESSDNDSDLPPALVQKPNPSRFNQSNARGKKKSKPHKTYGKRARRLGRQPQNQGQSSYYRQQTSTPDLDERNANDNEPLVRLHEGIVVDWSEEAWDEAYGGIIPEDMDGQPTFTNLQLLADEGLKKKQEQRSQRKKHGISLDDCLAEFEKEEILSEQDTWYCPRCKEHRRASKKFDLWKTPDILAVHLKRFSSAGWRREKLDVLVDFPIEGLDLTHRVIDKEDGRQEIYDLIAVDDHWGGLGGGHYTAFARNFIDGEWYSYNDTSVSKQRDLSKIVTSAAYLLFYRRRSEVPLGGPKFQEIFDRYDQQTQDAEDSDSGEGQRLGHGSSPRGSSSALQTGAGLTLHNANHGLASAHSTGPGQADNGALDEIALPDYGPLEDEDAGGLANDNAAGVLQFRNEQPLRRSIEVGEDEGVDLPDWTQEAVGRRDGPDSISRVIGTSWDFSSLPTGRARSEADDAMGLDADDDVDSTTAQNDDSSIAEDMEDEEATFGIGPQTIGIDIDDLEPILPEPGARYVLPDEPHPVMYNGESDYTAVGDDQPPPYDEQPSRVFVTADEIEHADQVDPAAEARVTEIHITDEEEAIVDPRPPRPQATGDQET